MAVIRLSQVAPVAAKLKFRGVLEAAYILRCFLAQQSNAEIRNCVVEKFGAHWGRPNQQRRYFDLVRTYVKLHHDADYIRFLLAEDLKIKNSDKVTLRHTLVRYLIEEQGIHGESEIVNDLG